MPQQANSQCLHEALRWSSSPFEGSSVRRVGCRPAKAPLTNCYLSIANLFWPGACCCLPACRFAGGTQNPGKLLGYVLLCLRLAELSVAGVRAKKPERGRGKDFDSLLQFVACEDCPELSAWLQQRRCELRRGPAAARCTCGCCGQQARRGTPPPAERAAAAPSAEQAGVSSTSGS